MTTLIELPDAVDTPRYRSRAAGGAEFALSQD